MTALKAKTRAAVLQIAEWQLGVVEMPSGSNKVKYSTKQPAAPPSSSVTGRQLQRRW